MSQWPAMKAAVLHAFGEPLVMETVAEPEPAQDGVVVAVRSVLNPDKLGHVRRLTS